MWLRQQMIVMSQDTNTPILYWLSMRMTEFRQWIVAHNELYKRY